MNDEIHSSTWEWFAKRIGKLLAPPQLHFLSHILGIDDDVRYGILRVTADQR